MEERDHVLDEVREHFVLKKLQERVWRLESENKELKVNNSILQTQYTSQCETQSDILRTLHANLDENYSKIEEQEAKIQRLEQEKEDMKQEFKDTLEEEKRQWETKVASLQVQNEDLENKLNEVREFQRNKEFMEAELDRLKRELQEQAESHARDISAFDRKKAIEIDQLKKDMNRSIRETRDMLRAKTKDQLDQMTKRTIMENEQMGTELHFQNKETERLLNSNNKLLEENAQLKRNLLIHKDLENELARRTHVYQKLIKKMDQKQKAELAARDPSRELRPGESLSEEASLEIGSVSRELPSAGLSQQNDEADRLRKQLEGVQGTLAMVRHEFAQYKRDHATLTQLQDQSTRLIISALYELKNQRECDPFPPASYDEHANWQFANMTPKQKEYFFRVLLEKLNSSMCGSCFPTGPQPVSAQQSVTSLPAINQRSPTHAAHGHFSQFLWSVATHGGQPSMQGVPGGGREVAAKSVQTETTQSDPCLKEGLWDPYTRKAFGGSPTVTPQMVTGGVRTWGTTRAAATQRGGKGSARIV